MSAWGHFIVHHDDPACPQWAREGNYDCSKGIKCPGVRDVLSKHADPLNQAAAWTYKRGADATHYAGYRYVTGRAGRTTRRDLHFCDACAAKWSKNNLPAPRPQIPAADPND